MGLLLNDSAAFPGYTFFAPMPYHDAYLINNEGRLVHSWPGTVRPSLGAYLCEDGLLLRTCNTSNLTFRAGGTGGRVELVDWDGAVTWAYDYSTDTRCQHHDATRLPNGNVLMVAWEWMTRQQAIAAGRNPQHLLQNSVWPDHLVEVNPATDSIVWEWHVRDHLVQEFDSTKLYYGAVRDHPELIDFNYLGENPGGVADWNHTNSVTYNARFDQVMVSVRAFSEVWVIDHSTTTGEAAGHSGGRYGRGGDLLYRWGNPAVYGRSSTGSQTLFGQHDCRWIADSLPGAGHMLVFNNGLGRPAPQYSTVDEFVPPADSGGFYTLGPDSTFGPAGMTWTYHGDFYASIISGCDRMPNGNTLVCQGTTGRLFEVTADTQVVWEYVSPVDTGGPMVQYDSFRTGSNQVFKTRRYAADYPGLAGRSLVPGDPIELYPQAVVETGAGLLSSRLVISPSPSSGRTFASFVLDHPGVVSLSVYDAAGRRVAGPVSAWLSAGGHSFPFNLDDNGAGAYLCVLRRGGAVIGTRPVVVSH